MDNCAEVREFLISRRADITAQQACMPDADTQRVPGLRRGEVAPAAAPTTLDGTAEPAIAIKILLTV